MKLGQTSAVYFVADVATSIAGFLATIYLTRHVASGVLGSYFLVVAVLIWLNVVLGQTVQQSVTKRLSEVAEGGYVGGGVVIQTAVFAILAVVILAGRGFVDAYVGAPVAVPLVGLLGIAFAFTVVQAVLKGQHTVHVAALLKPVDRGVRSVLQVGAVALGYGLGGLLVGYGVAAVAATVVGAFYIAVRVERPSREHVRSLADYARYSWLGMLSARAFASMDTLVLGLFVANNFVAYYEIAWNVASLLAIFGVAISETLFPELSKLATEGEEDRIRSVLDDALAYAGLFLLPGLVGAALVGDRVLAIYAAEYTRAATVLVVLVLARVVHAYGSQFTNALNGIDRPDLAFRVNAVFVGVNLAANVVLVYYYGWIGAAVATASSAVFTLLLGYRYLDSTVGVSIPLAELGRQGVAAVAMGIVVYAAEHVLPPGIPGTVVVVAIGAGVYLGSLTAISPRFRGTMLRNLPT